MKAVLMSDYADYVSTRVQSSPGMGRSRSGSANFGFRIALAAVLLYLSFAASLGELAGPSLNLGAIMALDTIGGKIARAAIELAVEDVNRNTSVLNGTLLNLHIRDSNQDALKGASGALELLRKGCVSIVGPQSSVVAEFVANLGSTAHVPVVTFAATNPSLSMHRFPFFIRMSHSDSMQMIAIAKLLQNYKWRDVVLVYEDDDFWNGAIPAFNDALRAVHANIVHRAAISPQADISVMRKVLQDELMKLESRVFIVHMSPESAITLSSQAYKLGMIRSPEYVWIITDGFASLLDSNPSSLMSMEGVLGVKRKIPQFNQPRVQEFTARWKQRFRAQNPTTQALELNAYALIAYDTVWAIANAIAQKPKLFTGNFLVASNSTKFLNLGVLEGGEQLKKQILDTNFLGLSGHVRLNAEKGEPLDSSYDIVNVIEGGCRVVGSWTKGEGLVLKQGVKWGGESGKVPRGWVKPVPGEKLKIGVPWERGFTELITIKPVHTATQNQTYDITGFCIDVFKAAVKRLEYELPHEFIPYGNGNVTEDYYDDLVYQVYLKKFDAVVGGVAVTANRSKYVDFTQPYADAGLSMTVVMEDDGSSEPWAFLLPFTPAVWITTLAFFFFTGAVVWLLEHRRNSQFRRGSRRKQVLTFLWFSFSTAFKTHTEIVESALGKAVVIIWFFVVLVLVSSYTASLSSMLTVKQMIPAVENVESLISKKMPIGYRQGSYIGKYFKKQLGVDKSLLRAYSSVQEYAIALKKGPDHGGVAAIFESQFTQNIFLSTGCNAYAKVGPTYKSGGLAFVFPKGSPLVSDISKAILNLSESRQMQDILNNWLNTSESNKCKSKSGGVESNRLSLRNFWVIFAITGCVSLLTLLYFLCRLLYRFVHRNDNPSPSPSPSPSTSHAKSISTSLRMLANYADQKDIPPPKRKRSDITIWSDELAEAAASPSSEIST